MKSRPVRYVMSEALEKILTTLATQPVDDVEIQVDSALVLNPAEKALPFYPNHPELVRVLNT